MAHDLCIQGGRVHMMYCKEPPWHGLGTRLDGPATSAEAMKAANLAWQVKKVPLYAAEFGKRVRLPGDFAITRADLWDDDRVENPPIFGLVKDAYTPVQNRDAFAFLDSIVGQGAAAYHTAGALGDGERVWMLVKLPSNLTVIGDDVAEKYLLLSNDHSGKGSVQVKFTPIRVVCQNTLTAALAGRSLIRLSHHRNVKGRLDEAKDKLGIIEHKFEELGESYRSMLRVQMDVDKLRQYLGAVFPFPPKANDKARERIEGSRALAEHFFAEGAGNKAKGVAGTLWAAFNGVTEFVDHRKTANMTNERRLNFVWFGTGAALKARAYSHAIAMAEGKDLRPDAPEVARNGKRRWLGLLPGQ